MQLIIKTKNLDLTNSLENLVNKKMSGLEKFLKSKDSKVFVEIEKETKHHRKGDIFAAEVIIGAPGESLVARAHGEDLIRALVQAREQLEREIRKHKAKIVELPRRKYRKIKKEEL